MTAHGRRLDGGEAVRRSILMVTLAAALAAPCAFAAGASSRPARAHHRAALRSFSSCDQLMTYVRRPALGLVSWFGIDGVVGAPMYPSFVPQYGAGVARPVAAPLAPPSVQAVAKAPPDPVEGVDYSGTNVQEPGVGEPDLIASDGRTLFTTARGRLQAVALRGAATRTIGTLPLPEGEHQLLRDGTRLVVITRTFAPLRDVVLHSPPAPGGVVAPIAPVPPTAAAVQLTEIDASDPAALHVVATMRLDGSYVAARMTGSTLRLVVTGPPAHLPLVTSSTGEQAAATARNRSAVAKANASAWLPRFERRYRGRTVRGPMVRCSQMEAPPAYSGLMMLSVLTIDADQGLRLLDADGVVGNGDIVSVSPTSLYVATSRWFAPAPQGGAGGGGVVTWIHRFDTSRPDRTVYRASGAVTGYLLNQWSMSEKDGLLRVASTGVAPWGSPRPSSESYVTVLDGRDGRLVVRGRIDGIGPGEEIQGVRFVGDRGYVVTFRQTDPLFVVDLADPAHPAVRGELWMPGFSSYLHPIGDDLLIGVGRDGDQRGWRTGTQVSLFDVSDPSSPRRVSHLALPGAWSAAESDHHAFLWWDQTRTLVIPVQLPAEQGAFSGAAAFTVGTSAIAPLGRIADPPGSGAAVERAMVAGQSLYTVSDAGVHAARLADLAGLAWAPFAPAP